MSYSKVVLTKYWNEEELLPEFLKMIKTLDWDALFLCNDGSTDTSHEICKQFAQNEKRNVVLLSIEERHDSNFDETIAESVKINDQFTQLHSEGYDWIFHLDIDEYVSTALKEFFNTKLSLIPPDYGIYFPIMDLFGSPTQFITYNKSTQFAHYPCPHMKIFGKDSKWRRTVHGMDLDQGVIGGKMWIMTAAPYFHLKYLFKNRRYLRGAESNKYFSRNPIFSEALQIGEVPVSLIPKSLLKWWKNWEEPYTYTNW